MKKIILAAVAVLFSTGAFAQHFEYGVKAGLNMATLTNFEGSKMKAGFNAGVFGEYVINDFFGVQAELVYSGQGVKVSADLLGLVTISANMNLDYINLPILAKFYVADGLSVDVGPQFGYMVGATSGGHSFYNVEDNGLNKFDISAALGLSYKLPFNLDVSARYNLGLTKVFDDDDNNRNGVIQVGVGYRF